MKAAFLCPCIGWGGAAAMQDGIMRYSSDLIDWTGIAVEREVFPDMLRWHRAAGIRVPIHQSAKVPGQEGDQKAHETMPEVNYHFDFLYAARAATEGADIAVSWCVQAGLSTYSWLDCPVVEFVQNSDKGAAQIARRNAPAADFYAACSESAREALPEEYRPKAMVIYNAADPGRVIPRVPRSAVRQKWEIPQDAKVALLAGRLCAEKEPELLAAALAHLPEQWYAVFVGRGVKEREIKETCDRHAHQRSRVVPYCYQIGDAMAAADVLVCPSHFEGDPLIVHEAHLAGLPVVVSDMPCIAEIDSRAGFELSIVVPRGCSSRRLAEGILKAVDDEAPIRVNNAFHFVRANLSMPISAAKWAEFLARCVFDYQQRRLLPRAVGVKGRTLLDHHT